MSEDKLTKDARKAYATAQKESDQASARDQDSVAAASASETAADGVAKSASPAKEDAVVKDTSEGSKTVPDGKKTPGEVSEEGLVPEDVESELAAAQEKRIAQLDDELARARADLYNLQQEYSNYVRRTKAEVPLQQEAGIAAVVNALMGVLDDVALAREHGDLKEGPFRAVVEKLESTLETKFKVKRYGQKGDAFDPNLHQAIQMMGAGDGEQVIEQVAQPGYLQGENVLRPAMVIVGIDTDGDVESAKTGDESADADVKSE